MAELKISEDLFLERQELRRWNSFVQKVAEENLTADMFISGILKTADDSNFDNFKVEYGTNVGTIKINTVSKAISKSLKVITKQIEDNILVTDDNQWYWVKIKHQLNPEEVGLVSIDNQGNLTGVGTLFTEVLRGQPNFPARIKFYDSALNLLEYDVVEVISDTQAVLSGVFQAEVDLKYSVIGTFTPGYVPPTLDKEIFQYDDCELTFVLETVLNTPPAKIFGEEYYIARVRRNGVNLFLEDKRNEIWTLKGEFNQINMFPLTNILIGVESLKWDLPTTPREFNECSIAWGFRSTNWTTNNNLRQVTLLGGLGGLFKDTTYFTNGDFDNWRIYMPNGKFQTIISSSISGTQINLTLDKLDPDDFPTLEELLVVPPVEQIEFRVRPDANLLPADIPILNNHYSFPINVPVGKIALKVPVSTTTYLYNIQYRYKLFNTYSDWNVLPDDAVGFYDESSFDADGNLGTPNQVPYAPSGNPDPENDGYILLTPHPQTYQTLINTIFIGDIQGIAYYPLSNLSPVKQLNVGVDKIHQIFNSGITLSVDHFINLNTTGAVNGNRFLLDFRNLVFLSTFSIKVVQGYVSPGTPGTTLFNFNSGFYAGEALNSNLLIYCEFDGTNWKVFNHISFREATSNSINATLTSLSGGLAAAINDINIINSPWTTDGTIAVTCNVGGTITVVNKNVKYQLHGKTLTIRYSLEVQITNASVHDIFIAYPSGIVPVGSALRCIHFANNTSVDTDQWTIFLPNLAGVMSINLPTTAGVGQNFINGDTYVLFGEAVIDVV